MRQVRGLTPVTLLLAGLLVLGALLGCSAETSAPAERDRTDRSASSDGPERSDRSQRTDRQPPPTVASEQQVEELLARRAAALRDGRRAAFLQTTAPGPDRRRQLAAFAALGELPVASAAYDVSAVEAGDEEGLTRVAAQLLVRLDGFDPRPVAASHVLELERGPDGWRVRSDRFAPSQVVAAPWTLAGARVRSADGVALVLDRGSQDQAGRLLRLAQEARSATRTWVPYPQTLGYVVLAPSSERTLRDDGFRLEEIERLGGIAREVDDRDGDVVTSRVVIAPDLLEKPDDALRNLLRHEFAHVTIGLRDRRMPLWVVEGLAEWASWRGDPSFRIATSAVREAEDADGITRMPPDADFRGEDSGTAYGVAWFAMKVLEQEHGPRAPYALLDRAAAERAFRPAEVSRVLEQEYGLDSAELARRAGKLIAENFEATD